MTLARPPAAQTLYVVLVALVALSLKPQAAKAQMAAAPAQEEPARTNQIHTALEDPVALAARGRELLAAGKAEAALPLLEAALLANPELLEARIDLALAYAALGHHELARALIAPLYQRSDLAAPLNTLWQPTTTLTVALAYTTNRTYAPATTQHLLADWPIPLTSRRPSTGYLQRIHLTHQNPTYAATLAHDHDPTNHAPFTALQLAAPKLVLTHIRWQHAALATELAAPLTAAATLAYRHWHQTPNLTTLRATYTLETLPLTLTLDLPIHRNRPGGTTLGLITAWTIAITRPNWRLTATTQLQISQDSRTYSPLLAEKSARTLASAHLTLSLEPTAATGWRPTLQLTHLAQKSNLTLFTLRRTELLLGIRTTW